MRILVTGSAGFIGFHLTARLLEEGHEVTGLDNFNAYYDVRLKRDRQAVLTGTYAGTGRLRFFEGDICDLAVLRDAFEQSRPECVVSLAAQPGMRDSLQNPFAYRKSNVDGFLNVLECCRYAMTRGRPVRVFNRGEMRRDFTYVDDIADGVTRCVAATGFEPFEIFNIGNNRPERLMDMIGLLADGLRE